MNILQRENAPRDEENNTYLSSNNKDAIKLETAKEKVTDNVSVTKEDGNMSLKMKDISIIDKNKIELNHEFPEAKKPCKC